MTRSNGCSGCIFNTEELGHLCDAKKQSQKCVPKGYEKLVKDYIKLREFVNSYIDSARKVRR